MVNEEILEYLKEGKRRGFSVDLLKRKLIEGGFDKLDVDEAVAYLSGDELPKQSILSHKELHGREPTKRRWMKVAGISGIILFSLGLIGAVLSFFVTASPQKAQEIILGSFSELDFQSIARSVLIITIITVLVLLTLTIIYWTGFIKMGRSVKSKLLTFSTWMILITWLAIVLGLAGFAVYFLISYQNLDAEKFFGMIVLTMVIADLIFLVSAVFLLLFSIAMIKNREVKFATVAGIFYALLSIYSIMSTGLLAYVLFRPTFLFDASGFLLQVGLFVLNEYVLIAWRIIVLTALILGSLSLFDASKKYE